MTMQLYINKKLMSIILEEILCKNLPINCTTGKTMKENDVYMIEVVFSFKDDKKLIFYDMLNRCMNSLF